MKRLREVTWKHCACVLLGLAIGVSIVAGWLIHSQTAEAVSVAEERSRTAAVGFAEAAEAWIDEEAADGWVSVDARQSFQRVVNLLLLDTAAYAQVVFDRAVILNSVEQGWTSTALSPVSSLSGRGGSATVRSIGGSLVCDVVVPIGPGAVDYLGRPVTYARIGYELTSLTRYVRSIRLAGIAIALSAFLVTCTCAGFIVAWLDHHGALRSPLTEIVRSFPVLRTSGPLVLDERAKRVTLHGRVIFLPPKPFQLLSLLVRERGRVLKEREIVETLWPKANLADSRDVRQCVYLLRKRLNEVFVGAGACIANVKGFGYLYDDTPLSDLPAERRLAGQEIAGSS